MNNKMTAFLAVVFASMFRFAASSEAQAVNTQALSPKQQSIVTISSFTANGDLEKLNTSLNEGLDAGLTVNEIKEILVQLYAYTGFPRSLNGINTFMFGDIFGRDNLDFRSREIATISALASMGGVNSQLQAHFNIGFNTGLTEAQMRSLISVLVARVGKKESDNANEIFSKVLSNRAK
jgi:alkylhydroperoxidase/carboxymuconolactone decarboxylase family protein YurZ